MSFQNIGRTNAKTVSSSRGRSFRSSEDQTGSSELGKQIHPLQDQFSKGINGLKRFENRDPLEAKSDYPKNIIPAKLFSPNTPSNPLNYRSLDSITQSNQNNMKVIRQTKSEILFRMSEEVSIYQREVGELSKAMNGLGNPSQHHDTNEWKFKQKMDQIEKRGYQIEKNLKSQEINIQNLPRSQAAGARSSHVRLTRDFRYVQGTFRSLKLEFKKRKEQSNPFQYISKADTSEMEKNKWNSEQVADLNEEEYALHAMHERETAISDINKKMHAVNEIYKDLGHIVVNQQEHIDLVENTIEQSCQNAKLGLGTLEKVNQTENRAFGNIFHRQQEMQIEQNRQFQQFDSLDKNAHAKQRKSDDCGIGLALDMSEFRKDLKGVGSEVMNLGRKTIRALQVQVMRCAIKN